MPRYFFHLRHPTYLHEDEDGTVLPNLQAALSEALRVGRELRGELGSSHGLEFEIADSTGCTVLKVPIQDKQPDPFSPPRARMEGCRISEQVRLLH